MNAFATESGLTARTLRRTAPRALFISALLVSAASASVARAQGTPSADTMKDIARQRYSDGVKAYDAGKWDEARAAFFQSYELTKVPAVLLNLGLSEVKGNHPVEGGNHLQQFLHDFKEAKPDQVASAKQAIEDAKKRAAQIAVTVSVAGADVSVDGALIGKSPLADAVFVEPGSRTVVASLNGKDGMARVDAKKGAVADASIVIASGSGDIPPAVPPVNPSQPPLVPVNPTEPVPNNGYPPGNVPPGQAPPVEEGHESFGHWYAHKPLAWVGTGLAAVGLGFGIGFSAAAASANSNTKNLAGQIRTYGQSHGLDSAPCSNNGGADAAGYSKACTSLRSSISTHNVDLGLAVGGWVAFGIGAAGTVTYVLVDWLPSKKAAPSDQAAPAAQSVKVQPIISPGYMGLSGQF